MKRQHTITIVPHHIPVGDGRVHAEFKVICECGWYDKAGGYPTNAARHREAAALAMLHNARYHGYTYKIEGAPS